jgi:hypothetical protein
MTRVSDTGIAEALEELKRVAWIYTRLIGEDHLRIRFETGTAEGLGEGHPNLGEWTCYVDIGRTTFCGTIVACTFQIKEQAEKKLGRGYL